MGWEGERVGGGHLIAAHICVSSWAQGAPVQPISPHQTHSLGLSVNTNTNIKGPMREGKKHTSKQKNKLINQSTNRGQV